MTFMICTYFEERSLFLVYVKLEIRYGAYTLWSFYSLHHNHYSLH